MKKLQLLIAILLSFGASAQNKLIPFYNEEANLWGFKNEARQVIQPPIYNSIWESGDTCFIVSKNINNETVYKSDYRFGILNRFGKEILPLVYGNILIQENGLILVNKGAFENMGEQFENPIGGKWGVLNPKLEEIVPLIYDEISIFEDKILVNQGATIGNIYEKGESIDLNEPTSYIIGYQTEGGKWGALDQFGTEVIPIKYDSILNTTSSALIVREANKINVIDWRGKEFIPEVTQATIGFNNLIAVSKKTTEKSNQAVWGLFDSTGKEIMAPQYDSIVFLLNSVIAVKDKTGWSFVNQYGQSINSKKYQSFAPFQNDIPLIAVNEQHIITEEDYLNWESQYIDEINPYWGKTVVQNGPWGWIDSTGKEIMTPQFNSIQLKAFSKDWIEVSNSDPENMPSEWFYVGFDNTNPYEKSKCNCNQFYSVESSSNVDYDFTIDDALIGNGIINLGVINRNNHIVVPCEYVNIVQNYTDNASFYITEIDGKKGVISTVGDRILPNEFSEVELKGTSYFLAKNATTNQWLLFDLTGKQLTTFDNSEKVAYLQKNYFKVTKNGKTEVVNEKNQPVIPTKYSEYPFDFNVEECNDLGFSIKRDSLINSSNGSSYTHDLWGFIDFNYQLVVKPKFCYISNTAYGYVVTLPDPKDLGHCYLKGFIDLNGKTILSNEYNAVYPIVNGFILTKEVVSPTNSAEVSTTMGVADKTGKIIVPLQKQEITPLKNGYLVSRFDPSCQITDYYGVFDLTGKLIIPVKYKEIKELENGYLASKDTLELLKTVYFDKSGKVVFPLDDYYLISENPYGYFVGKGYNDDFGDGVHYVFYNHAIKPISKEYNEINRFQLGVAIVMNQEKRKTIDPNNNEEFILTKDQYGLIDSTGKEIIAPTFDEIEILPNKLVQVKKDEKLGLFSISGKALAPVQYDYIGKFTNGFAKVKLNGQWVIIDEKGKQK